MANSLFTACVVLLLVGCAAAARPAAFNAVEEERRITALVEGVAAQRKASGYKHTGAHRGRGRSWGRPVQSREAPSQAATATLQASHVALPKKKSSLPTAIALLLRNPRAHHWRPYAGRLAASCIRTLSARCCMRPGLRAAGAHRCLQCLRKPTKSHGQRVLIPPQSMPSALSVHSPAATARGGEWRVPSLPLAVALNTRFDRVGRGRGAPGTPVLLTSARFATPNRSYIGASYVKWVEAAGGRIAPVR